MQYFSFRSGADESVAEPGLAHQLTVLQGNMEHAVVHLHRWKSLQNPRRER